MTQEAALAAERAAREAHGRLVAWLAWRWGDPGAAQDAVGDALLAALETWPRDGVPANPAAWLLTAARNRLREGARHARVAADPAVTILFDDEEAEEAPVIPDERLRLLFACAHPGIERGARTALMLQCVLGFDAARIAAAFLVSPAAMSQRLVRAKARIREDRLMFEMPGQDELASRVDAVLEAIYAAFGSAWDAADGSDDADDELGEEAIWLARTAAAQLPGEAEAWGLLALLLHCHARRAARGSRSSYVPLEEQDCGAWDMAMLEEAEACLERAASLGRIGPFQLEAAIQSAHAQRARGGAVEWRAVAMMYDALAAFDATLGVRVARAAAHARAHGAAAGVALLQAIDAKEAAKYQPYWAVAASLAAARGEREAAATSYQRAIGLTRHAGVRRWLLERCAEVSL